MASESETVAEIVQEMRKEVENCRENHPNPTDMMFITSSNMCIDDFAKRIEAAHRREIAELRGDRNGILKANASLAADNDRLRRGIEELRECLKEAVGEKCAGCAYIDNESSAYYGEVVCGNKDCKYHKWRKALEGSNHDNA